MDYLDKVKDNCYNISIEKNKVEVFIMNAIEYNGLHVWSDGHVAKLEKDENCCSEKIWDETVRDLDDMSFNLEELSYYIPDEHAKDVEKMMRFSEMQLAIEKFLKACKK